MPRKSTKAGPPDKALAATGAKAPQRAGEGQLARKSPGQSLLGLLIDRQKDFLGLGKELAGIASSHPQETTSFTDKMSRWGVNLATIGGIGSDSQKSIMRLVLLYRQQIVRELEISTSAEFLLLDAAMDAYAHWMHLTALVRSSFEDGTSGEKSKLQSRLASTAQSYLKTYTDSIRALTEMKLPPLRVLNVQAGHTVAVQVNEQAKAGRRQGSDARADPPGERRELRASAPAAAGAADQDPD